MFGSIYLAVFPLLLLIFLSANNKFSETQISQHGGGAWWVSKCLLLKATDRKYEAPFSDFIKVRVLCTRFN